MPLLQGQPFRLVELPDTFTDDEPVYTIQHTGEKFLNKREFEDRLALYSQNIWTCQCTGHSGLSHKEAWMSEAKVRAAAEAAIPISLQRSLLSLVHHSLSPLEQLIEASSILCCSQFHIGENVILLYPKQVKVRVVKSKDVPKHEVENCVVPNGIASVEGQYTLNNGSSNGAVPSVNPGASPDKENHTKDNLHNEESENRHEMLPKLYDVVSLEDNTLIENVPSKHLLRPYKVPSKEQIRLFIRSCALRLRGSTCTPWVVTDDLVKKFSISNKLPALFCSPPKPKIFLPKRKSESPANDSIKRVKADLPASTQILSGQNAQIENIDRKSQLKFPKSQTNLPSVQSTSNLDSHCSSHSIKPQLLTSKNRPKILSTLSKIGKSPAMKNMSFITKSSKAKVASSSSAAPRKRGRPPLSQEEKERNKKLRQASLLELTRNMKSNLGNPLNVIKVKGHVDPVSDAPPSMPPPASHPLINSFYKSPVKRANTAETVMKLPFMRKFAHEHKTIKGVLGQFRRYAHTMDVVLSKLSPAQIDLIPEESLKQDLRARQKKVQEKKYFEKLTPEERKQHFKDKARSVALERWKERKLKNLKVEDNVVKGLQQIPLPTLVETPQCIGNSLFGDVVLITDFIKCFHELLLGEEKFRISTQYLMEAISSKEEGYCVIADIMCCILPTIVHDDISKNCSEIGIKLSVIPINYQTAPELARLCLRKQDEEDALSNTEENDQIGTEKTELSDELLLKLECTEFWELTPVEIIAVLKALVHKSLCTATISIHVDEVDQKVLLALRERRKFMKQLQKTHKAELSRRKEEKIQNKSLLPKRQRGRPKGYSPKLGRNILDCVIRPAESKPENPSSISAIIQKRRMSTEMSRKEKEENLKQERERQKQVFENHKRQTMDKKYEDLVFKRDNLLRRNPVGFDRHHNRYWIFHTTTPGLYVEKGWVDQATDYKYTMYQTNYVHSNSTQALSTSVKLEEEVTIEQPQSSECQATTTVKQEKDNTKDELESPQSVPKVPDVIPESKDLVKDEEDITKGISDQGNSSQETPELIVAKNSAETENDNLPLSKIKSKLSISPMKMSCRGRPPKEAYILVDEDTQTFPTIEENKWYFYKNMEEVKHLLDSLSDQGLRESQLIAALNMNKDRLQYHYNKKSESLQMNAESSSRLKQSLKEDIIQIERELIEGWLGSVSDFTAWESRATEADGVCSLGALLIEVQQSVQLKNLKGIMSPVKEQIPSESVEGNVVPEYRDVENPSVAKWKEAVTACQTYSRLHVLVGLFDSCIRWEKSMATRKCKVCRSKAKEDPLVMCAKCETNYHWYCMRPPLKEDPGDSWCCPACMPKKSRREETVVEQETNVMDEDEKGDPTFSLSRYRNNYKKKSRGGGDSKKQEKECVVCGGRVGLIVCSRCATAFHSECHNPPLMSRARKNWECGDCLDVHGRCTSNSNKKSTREHYSSRRDSYEEAEVSRIKRSAFCSPRDSNGRFRRGAKALPGGSGSGSPIPVDAEGGRGLRGAKARALSSFTLLPESSDGRRSSRARSSKRSYKDSDDNEEDTEEEQEEVEEEVDVENEEVEEEEQEVDVENEEEREDEDIEEEDEQEEGTGEEEEDGTGEGDEEEEGTGEEETEGDSSEDASSEEEQDEE